MTEIIFLKTRYKYDSYHDFWALVEISQFPVKYVDELRLDEEGVYITAPYNGEYEPHFLNEEKRLKELRLPRMAHTILWNLERPSGSGSIGEYVKSNRDHLYKRLFDEIWVSDAKLADDTQFRFVVLGSDVALGYPGEPAEKKYDFCHMSAINPRRESIYSRFSKEMVGQNAWPWEPPTDQKYSDKRDEILKASRFALNIHQDNNPYQEPLRMALFAAYGLPIISETCYNASPYVGGETVYFAPYLGIVGSMRQALENDYGRWREIGLRGRDVMTGEYRFRDMVSRAIEQSVGGIGWR